jgi:hypothetical protein
MTLNYVNPKKQKAHKHSAYRLSKKSLIENLRRGRKGTYRLSAFIFNALGSAGWDSAPNFPPHDLGDFEWNKDSTYLLDFLKLE